MPTDLRAFEASGLPEAFALRGSIRVLADFGDGVPYDPPDQAGTLAEVSPELRAIVRGGQIGYAWQTMGGAPVLVVGGQQGGPPELYFVYQASPIENALAQLRFGLLAAGIAAIAVALLVAGIIARWLLRPVAEAGAAARRIASGDLAARVPERGSDEVGRWAADFNRMADSLEQTVGRLETAQHQNRAFVADVAHELRTPITALVAEASLIEGQLDGLPPDGRRAAELLVRDVRRLRVLVDDLMEVSRFDADAEHPTARARRPRARRDRRRGVPAARGRGDPARRRRSSSTPTRAGSTGSSATSSTTPATTRPGRRSRWPSRRLARAR